MYKTAWLFLFSNVLMYISNKLVSFTLSVISFSRKSQLTLQFIHKHLILDWYVNFHYYSICWKVFFCYLTLKSVRFVRRKHEVMTRNVQFVKLPHLCFILYTSVISLIENQKFFLWGFIFETVCFFVQNRKRLCA